MKRRFFLNFLLLAILVFLFTGAARYNTVDGEKSTTSLTVPTQWQPYLNYKTDEFWTEGNHKPDAGFVIFAKNPTLENAKLWLLRNEIKAKQLNQMLTLVEEAQRDLVKNGLMEDRYGSVKNEGSLWSKISKKIGLSKIDSNNKNSSSIGGVQMFFLFSPSCGHCKRMAETLRGFPQVQPLQVELSSPLKNWNGLKASEYASKSTLDTYVKNGAVPVLLLYSPSLKTMQVLRGEQTTESILSYASNLFKKRGV